MRRETAVIILLILLSLLPMWYVAVQSSEKVEAVQLNTQKGGINPVQGFVHGPGEIGPNLAGVIIWIALFALVGMLWYSQEFIPRIANSKQREASRTSSGSESVAMADGSGETPTGVPGFVLNEHRELAEYVPANNGMTGLWLLTGLSLTTISFSYLLVQEGLGLARTQFIGVYSALAFFSLAAMVMVYAAWFMPVVKVSEKRSH